MSFNKTRQCFRELSIKTFSFLLFLFLTFSSYGQKFPFREYTTDDGLPQSQSLDVMQDSRGYMWIPTRNGLAQFDGHTFKSYFRRNGLPSNLVTRVIEDADGTLWAITANGIARFNGNEFRGYPLPDSLRIKQIGFASQTEENGRFFLVAGDSLGQQRTIIFDNGKYLEYSTRYSVFNGLSLRAVAYDKRDSSLYLLDPERKLFKFCHGRLSPIHKGPVDKVEIRDSLRVYTHSEAVVSDPVIPGWNKGNIMFSVIDHEGTLWIGTESKVYRLVSEAFLEYDESDGLPVNPWAIAPDPSGGLWIGSVNGELVYFDGKRFIPRNDYKKLFNSFTAFFRGSTSLSNGEVWLSMNVGVLIWDGIKFRRLNCIPYGEQVCIIFEDPVDRSVFIGTDRALYHLKGSRVSVYTQMSEANLGVAEGIARDDNGNYWIASHLGIVFFDGKEFTRSLSAPAQTEMVWGVLKDNRGNIWSAGSDGLFICDPDEPYFKPALPDEINRPANVIRDMGDGRLIAGRMLDICIIDLEKYYAGKKDYYSILGRSRGYTGNDCQDNGIVRDADGRWWLLASDKLVQFDPGKIRKNEHPPAIHITLAEQSGDSLALVPVLDSALFYDTGNHVIIRGKNKDLRISYTGISTTNPEDVTFEYRMSGLTQSWSERTKERSVIFSDLAPGEYMFEVNAYNADGIKSPEPDTLMITVVPPFLNTLTARIIMTLMALASVVALSFQIRKRLLERRIEAARQQAESYRLQLNSVIRQLDPHFTFNALTSVGSLIMKGEKEKTYNYFIKLSGLLRSVLSDSAVLLKPLKEEADFVTRYCELQKLRFGDRFDYSIKIDSGVDQNIPVPKMIIQAFAENAVKHGFENKKDRGILLINITGKEKGIEVIVRDNGVGREAASKLQTDGHGMGLKNINSIITMMNRVNTERITVDLTDLYDNGQPAGTQVRVFLPYNYTFDLPRNTDQELSK